MLCDFICKRCKRKFYNKEVVRKYCRSCYNWSMKIGTIQKEQKYKYNLQTFYNEDAISYYILGAFITDGWLITNKNKTIKYIGIASKDKDWLEIIKNYICPEKPILKKKNSNCYYVEFHNTEIGNWFESHGCILKKSLIVKFPNIPEQYIPDFIRGCWDGDGSITFKKNKVSENSYIRSANLTSGSLEFSESICKNLNTLGIKCNVRKYKVENCYINNRLIKSSTVFRVHIQSGKHVYNLCKLLYNNKVSMPRKYMIAQNLIKNWEKKYFCTICNSEITSTKKVRSYTKYCCDCAKIQRNKKS